MPAAPPVVRDMPRSAVSWFDADDRLQHHSTKRPVVGFRIVGYIPQIGNQIMKIIDQRTEPDENNLA